MLCYSHLSDDERELIGLAKAVGDSIGAIAQAIGRPKSTISRELSRNQLPSGRYSLIVLWAASEKADRAQSPSARRYLVLVRSTGWFAGECRALHGGA